MRFVSWLAATLLASSVAVSAHADADEGAASGSAANPVTHVTAMRDEVTSSFEQQLAVVERTRATVLGKLAEAKTARAARVRTAYRVLREQATVGSDVAQWLDGARKRAAARLLLDRDRSEVLLLANESQQLALAQIRIAADSVRAATAPLPSKLRWPVDSGEVVRGFGPFIHERSKATLSRHGVDIDVEQAAAVHAMADGTIRYLGEMRGLDRGIIIDHGDYLTVIGKLAPQGDDATLVVGSKVTRGQIIGHAARERVYFEVRVAVGPGGTPITPPMGTKAP